ARRIFHCHLKDIRTPVLEESLKLGRSFLGSIGAGVFTVPGDGCLDFPKYLGVLAENDFQGWLVVEAEQDPAKANPLEYALKARKYLREITGL
ncbi:MAG TPA: TIM barrel protein, partial [Urbifossiella sp.]|nr:TIM barrel protein [Urbifossiella sp.]